MYQFVELLIGLCMLRLTAVVVFVDVVVRCRFLAYQNVLYSSSVAER